MKIVYKESIVDMIERVKGDAFNKNRTIEKVILTWDEFCQAEKECHLKHPVYIKNHPDLICNIPFEVEVEK